MVDNRVPLSGRGGLMKTLSILGIVFSAGIMPSALLGQTVAAKVYQFDNASALAGATILLVDSSGVVQRSAVTDSTGSVVLRAPFVGMFSLRLRRIGWHLVHEPEVMLAAGAVADLDLVAREIAVELDPIAITVDGVEMFVPPRLRGFYRRRARGRGWFLTAEDLETRNPMRITHALSMIPGVRLYTVDGSHMTVRMNTAMGMFGSNASPAGGNKIPGCPPLLYLDGTPIGGIDDMLDTIVFPHEVAGIEVYRRASELPAEFSGSRSGCGVIVIWTKRGPPAARRDAPARQECG